MSRKRSKRAGPKRQIRKLENQATTLFILFLILTGLFCYAIYQYYLKGPITVYSDNGSRVDLCRCYYWGCYCCPKDWDYVRVYDLERNLTNIAVYDNCTLNKMLPDNLAKDSIEDLTCKELLDYRDNGRRCTGLLKLRCIYPYIWNKKAVLKDQIRVKNCTVS